MAKFASVDERGNRIEIENASQTGAGKGTQDGEFADLIKQRHPVWKAHNQDWNRFRKSYVGGRSFINDFLMRYSKRENVADFEDRKTRSYNSSHVKGIINTIRNSLVARFPEITRTGDELYLDLYDRDVDLNKNSWIAFSGMKVIPDILTTGAFYCWIDSPPRSPDETRADAEADGARPYLVPIKREDVLTWSKDNLEDRFTAVLIREVWDTVDPETKLTTGADIVYRYAYINEAGSVTVRFIDKDGHRLVQGSPEDGNYTEDGDVIIEIDRIPFVEISIDESLLVDIADMAVAILNIESTDNDFLIKNNFPQFTKQVDPRKERYRYATVEHTGSENDAEFYRDFPEYAKGNNTALTYEKETERPDYIAPPVDNVRVSMEKQNAIVQQMRLNADLQLSNMSIKALEASGESKKMDRLPQDVALTFLAGVIQTGDIAISWIFHLLLGYDDADIGDLLSVEYPVEFEMLTDEDRYAKADRLAGLRDTVPSPTYWRELNKRIVDLTATKTSEETLTQIKREVEEAQYFRANQNEAAVISQDIMNGLVSKETASILRGYAAGEVTKAADEALNQFETPLFGSVLDNAGNDISPEDENPEDAEGGDSDNEE